MGIGSVSRGVPLYTDQRCVGIVYGTTLRKPVQPSRHMLRKPCPAWALDEEALDRAEDLGAEQVELKDLDTGLIYSAAIALIREKGTEFERGHGAQIYLPVQLWSVSFEAKSA